MINNYLANKEFIKYLRHNGHTYKLKSVFDTDNSKYDFDNAIAKYNNKTHKFDFDNKIKNIKYNSYDIQDDLNTIYNDFYIND